jgi:hypothetical protein
MLLYVRFRCLLGMLALLALLGCAPLYAGAPPITVDIQSIDDAYALVSPALSAPVTKTITLTFDANGAGPGFVALLNSLAIQGVNAADFTIVAGGTCTVGTMLDPSTPSCTVIVQYLPSSNSAENAQLAVNCSTVGLVGGFTLNCAATGAGTTGTISLLGSVVAAIVQGAPALSPRLLTMLAALLVGAGTYFAARRNG